MAGGVVFKELMVMVSERVMIVVVSERVSE